MYLYANMKTIFEHNNLPDPHEVKVIEYQQTINTRTALSFQEFEIALVVHHYVLKLQITVHKSAFVHFSQCLDNLHHIELDLSLVKPLTLLHNRVKFAAIYKGHNVIETGLSLEKVVHSGKEWMINFAQNMPLCKDLLYRVCLKHEVFADNLYSVEFACAWKLRKEYLAKSSFTDLFLDSEVTQRDTLLIKDYTLSF